MSFSKQFPYFGGYLSRVQHDPIQARVESSLGVGCMSLAIFAPLCAGFGGVVGGPWVAVGAGLGAFTLGAIGLGWLQKRASKPRNDYERTLQAAARATHEMKQLRKNRKLHRWLDPVALQLLEAGAYHWTRVAKALESPTWSDDRVAGHWRAARDQMRTAADQAMVELVLLGQTCLGPPPRDRKDDLRELMSDLADLDIADALDGLRSMAETEWTAYAYQSPQSRAIFEPARQIAERLKRLADEIEATVPMTLPAEGSGVPIVTSTDSIDLVLGEVRALRQAEDEVRNQHLGQG